MADKPTTTARAVWDAALEARTRIVHNQAPTPRLEERLAALEEQLLALPAPDLAGVTTKLEMLWQGDLHGRDADSVHKLLVLDDIRRLASA